MKAWIVCRQKYDGAIWGSVDRETMKMYKMMGSLYQEMEIHDEYDTYDEATDMAEGLNAMERVDQT